jgi:type VI secretion system secreted protein VgrG
MNNFVDAGLQLLGKLDQQNRLLRMHFPNEDGPAAVMVANRLDAREALSRDFRFVVEVISDDATIALKDVQGKMVTVELVREDGSLRYFNGYVFEFRRDCTDGAQVYYNMVLVPWMSYLRLRRNNTIFHHQSLREQSDHIFATYPVRASELRINGSDPALTYACQYGESDYNYLHRRWEEKGWYYWYEHSASGHKLILSDDSTQAPAIDGDRGDIPFQSEAGAIEDDGIADWTPVRRLVSSSIALSSFDFKDPRPAAVDLPTVNKQGDVLQVESYDYTGAYGFKDTAEGDAQARLRLEEIEASAKYFDGYGNDRTAQAGRKFTLSGHFDDSGDGDCDFLILDAHHTANNNYQSAEASAGSQYTNRITCSRTKIPWRPGRGLNSTAPKIYGIQTAMVVGPAGEEIYTDEYGRVRVQFHWDRIGKFDEKSSAWVRVATPWAGASFGMTSIPRIGSEVIVQFLDGNPDRPLVMAMVPNADTMPPWELPANKTQSGILSRSTPGGAYENANAIRFEDKKGAEQVWIQAERDMQVVVEKNDSQSVGADRSVNVGGSHTEGIAKDMTHTVGGARTEIVKKNMTLNVTEGRQDSTVKGDITITSEGGEITVTSPTKITFIVGGSSITMTPAEVVIIGGKIFLNP